MAIDQWTPMVCEGSKLDRRSSTNHRVLRPLRDDSGFRRQIDVGAPADCNTAE
jgi:hypothetical protein